MLRILLSASVVAVSLAGTSVAEVSDERGIEEVVVTAGSSIQERLVLRAAVRCSPQKKFSRLAPRMQARHLIGWPVFGSTVDQGKST